MGSLILSGSLYYERGPFAAGFVYDEFQGSLAPARRRCDELFALPRGGSLSAPHA